MNQLNGKYGHRVELCRYMGIDPRPLPFVIPHGIYGRNYRVARAEAEDRGQSMLSYPAYRDSIIEREGFVPVPSAAPFVYALDNHGVAPRPSSGSLFFMAHSIPTHDVKNNIASIIAALKDLPGPVTVCVHPHDAQSLHAKALRRAGYSVTTAGDYMSRDFLVRTLRLIGAARYVFADAPGTSSLYAMVCGRPFALVGDTPQNMPLWTQYAEIAAACGDRHEDAPACQAELARRLLRVEAQMSPAELRELVAFLDDPTRRPRPRYSVGRRFSTVREEDVLYTSPRRVTRGGRLIAAAGESMSFEEARRRGLIQKTPSAGQAKKPDRSIKEIKALLDERGIQYKPNARKADLEALLT